MRDSMRKQRTNSRGYWYKTASYQTIAAASKTHIPTSNNRFRVWKCAEDFHSLRTRVVFPKTQHSPPWWWRGASAFRGSTSLGRGPSLIEPMKNREHQTTKQEFDPSTYKLLRQAYEMVPEERTRFVRMLKTAAAFIEATEEADDMLCFCVPRGEIGVN